LYNFLKGKLQLEQVKAAASLKTSNRPADISLYSRRRGLKPWGMYCIKIGNIIWLPAN